MKAHNVRDDPSCRRPRSHVLVMEAVLGEDGDGLCDAHVLGGGVESRVRVGADEPIRVRRFDHEQADCLDSRRVQRYGRVLVTLS